MVSTRSPHGLLTVRSGQIIVRLPSAQGSLMVWSRSAYGLLIVSTRSIHDLLTVRPWSDHGPLTVRSWFADGMILFRLRSAHGQHTVPSRSAHDTIMVRPLMVRSQSAHDTLTVRSLSLTVKQNILSLCLNTSVGNRTVPWLWSLVWTLLLKHGEEYLTGCWLNRDRPYTCKWGFRVAHFLPRTLTTVVD